MKARMFVTIAAVIAIAGLIYGYTRLSKEKIADEQDDQPITSAARVESANGTTIITLDANRQQMIGLRTVRLAAATLSPEAEGYGRVLDSAALVSLKNNVISAEAALAASEPEYERLKKLSAQNNTSVFALQSAEARVKRDQGALETARAQLTAASGKALSGKPADFFQQLARQQSVLIRLDLPAGQTIAETPTAARLQLPGSASVIAAEFLCRAASTDPQNQGEGFLFIAANAPAQLAPGLALSGFLQFPGEPLHGVLVPDAAVIRVDDRDWIYIQTDGTNFVRREISLSRPTAQGWFVTNSIVPGDKVVVLGGADLISEESKSQIKLED